MCGRFFIYDETMDAIERLAWEIKADIKKEQRTGDIHPSERAMVISAGRNGMVIDRKRWGFPGFATQKVLINARAETVLEKRMFRDSVLNRRIIIPAAGFYEWNPQKEKVTFTLGESAKGKTSVLYMAGFYRRVEGEDRFIILTTGANDSMREVHDRMPLILEENELEEWLYEDNKLEALLSKEPGMLHKGMEYEQRSLF